MVTFRNLAIAYEALRRGGNSPCVINAANEVAVAAFLEDQVRFLGIAEVIEYCLSKATFVPTPSYDDYVQTDEEVRQIALSYIRRHS
jgi:1-deoxy-D-xylulose-5-phosphate reductoisomerase